MRSSKEVFITAFKKRTKTFSVEVIKLCRTFEKSDMNRIIIRQLVKSATSTAANYRAACRGRSRAEFFSKMSIVVEEADETLFWLEVVEEAEIDNSQKLKNLQQESLEILSVVAKARKNTK